MNDLISLLSSKEALIVYIVIAIATALCIIIYIVEKHSVKAKQRHNTKELNKLVEKIQEEVPLKENKVIYDKPVLETVTTEEHTASLDEMLQYTAALYRQSLEEERKEETPEIIESTPIVVEKEVVEEKKTSLPENKVELEYTTIEPNKEEAQKQIEELTEELQQQSEIQNETLTPFEEQQEENAIISLQELMEKSKTMYEANELTQYADEGNVPISLGELEQKIGRERAPIEEPFVIENMVPQEELKEEIKEEVKEEIVGENKRFKNSPIISPIYGIEKQNDIALENTANYEKFDAEVQKTNEFLMTLKELQENVE